MNNFQLGIKFFEKEKDFVIMSGEFFPNLFWLVNFFQKELKNLFKTWSQHLINTFTYLLWDERVNYWIPCIYLSLDVRTLAQD